MNIAALDKNLKIDSKIGKPDILWLDATNSVFNIYGAAGVSPFVRVPVEVGGAVSEGVSALNYHTAGIRIRFRTDSPYIAIHAEWEGQCKMSHMPICGMSGFDLYTLRGGTQRYLVSLIPPFCSEKGYESAVNTSGKMTDYVLNFPLYNDVKKLYIGIKKGSAFEEPAGYYNRSPVVFYGSSITQGGCASRPGNCYQNFLSRALNMDYINLGFSGNAKGEPQFAEYISGLKMAAFVCDYDYNAPTAEHLKNTHYRFYEIIREKNPDLPYVMLTAPIAVQSYENGKRRSIIMSTYEKAIASGDKNVYFVDGASIFTGENNDNCTVDGCHPNDIGFYKYYKALFPVLRNILYR